MSYKRCLALVLYIPMNNYAVGIWIEDTFDMQTIYTNTFANALIHYYFPQQKKITKMSRTFILCYSYNKA